MRRCTRVLEGSSISSLLSGYPSIMAGRRSQRPKAVQPFRGSAGSLDDVDRRLLHELAEDARLPNNTLAERVGIAPSTCSLRVRRLRDLGAIRGFYTDIAPEALGLPIHAMVSVRLRPAARARIGDYTARLAALPGVLNVYFLAGSVDFLIQVVADSPDALRDFVTRHLSASQEFDWTETSLVFDHARNAHPD
jgi:DNA-binding Lrp family transcriptional regulator